MFSISLAAVALAGAVTAFTPPGFQPASDQNLSVVFGDVLATNGKDIPKAETAQAPVIGTINRLFGTYTVMMVDPDIPPAIPGGPTTELLHWMQSDLVSSNSSSIIGGVQIFELINPSNTSALATYLQPSPPDKTPHTHRYTQLLLNTTGNSPALATLSKLATTRTNFDAVSVIQNAGLTVLAGNSFNVTNTTLVQSNITKTTSVPAGASSSGTSSTVPNSAGDTISEKTGSGALIAGLGALAAAMAML